jgi:hypothetical protein
MMSECDISGGRIAPPRMRQWPEWTSADIAPSSPPAVSARPPDAARRYSTRAPISLKSGALVGMYLASALTLRLELLRR